MNEIAVSICALIIMFTIQHMLMWWQVSSIKDNLGLINHNLSKIVDIFESEKFGDKRGIRR